MSGFVGYNGGTIENSYSDAIVTGGYGIGFVYNNGSNGTINNCYSKTPLTGYGFYSHNSGKITGCYYDKDLAGTTTHGTPKATLAMKVSSTYTGWDFGNVWDIDSNLNNGYPYLRIEQNFLPGVDSITFDKQEFYLQTGGQRTVTAEVIPNDTGRKQKWSSSDETVATVSDDGTVTAVGAGDAEITLSMGNYSNFCTVHVVDDLVSVNGVSLDRTSLALDKGSEYTLTAALDPANATDKAVAWTSSAPDVASVDENGRVIALADGTAVIMAVTNDGGYSAQCSVSVRTPVKDIRISSTSLDMYVGKVETLTAEITPADATNKSVVWTSSDDDIATVADGIVTARKAGSAVITVTTEDGGLYEQCAVTVTVPVDGITLNKTSAQLALGESTELIPTIDPANASDQKII